MWWDRRASASPGWPGEAAVLATDRGVEVVWAFCESHAQRRPVLCRVAAAAGGHRVAELEGEAARARVREQVPDADSQDVLLLDDLLGIADPEVALPAIDADARRRRLTALINAATLARTDRRFTSRGCALGRCGQRVDAGRLPYRHSTDQVDGADYLAPRV